ncbi:hypothetical protein C8R47DRAFT_1209253 [Mycena vitilis]|nr:hypothetical protein C8R47DRAFT_1209253 [Mycena vitilis]
MYVYIRGFEFMRPLVDDMVQDDPMKRPKIDSDETAIVARFAEMIQKGLSSWKLRSYVPHRVVGHWTSGAAVSI